MTVYPKLRRRLHWAVAALVVAMIPAGWFFTDFDNKPGIEGALGAGSFNVLYDMHKTFGFIVLGLMILRLGAWALWPNPAYATPLPEKQEKAAKWTHRGLYALLFLVPLLGWAGVSAFPAPLPVFYLFEMPPLLGPNRDLSRLLLDVHGWLAIGIGIVAAVHVGAALYHLLVRRDGVFERMAPPKGSQDG